MRLIQFWNLHQSLLEALYPQFLQICNLILKFNLLLNFHNQASIKQVKVSNNFKEFQVNDHNFLTYPIPMLKLWCSITKTNKLLRDKIKMKAHYHNNNSNSNNKILHSQILLSHNNSSLNNLKLHNNKWELIWIKSCKVFLPILIFKIWQEKNY